MDVLELEARELADDPGPGLDHRRDAHERPADVAGDLDGATGGAEDRTEQLGRRRLAVGAGHADERIAGQQPVAELDLAPDGHAEAPLRGGQRRFPGYAGALDDGLDTAQQRLLHGPDGDFA